MEDKIYKQQQNFFNVLMMDLHQTDHKKKTKRDQEVKHGVTHCCG